MKKKLLYVYIEQYGALKEIGFNLSSDFQITLSKDINNDNLPTFSIHREKNAFADLYDENIVDIKGIIGENGAGKSTLLRYLAFKANGHPEHDLYRQEQHLDIVVLLDIDEFNTPVIRVYAGNDWKLTEKNIKLYDIPFQLYVSGIEEINWDDIYSFNTSIIYYSNIFDTKQEATYNGLYNISTNFLIREDLERFTNNPFKLQKVSELVAHSLRENTRRVSFALAFQGKLPFDLPKEMFVYFNGGLENSISSALNDLKSNGDEIGKQIGEEAGKWLNRKRKIQTFSLQEKLHKEYLDYLILNQLTSKSDDTLNTFYPKYKEYKLKVLKLFNEVYKEKQGIANFYILIRTLENYEKEVNENQVSGLGDSSISRFIRHLELLDRELSPLFGNRDLLFSTGFRLPISNTSYDVLVHYRNSLITTDYLSFSFPDLSSGELGFLTLFSRFYSLVDNLQIGSPDLLNNLLILIDEGDLYFHPKWQVLFLNYINEVLPLIFPGRNIQLIISSHSPFIASDLPGNNLLLLRKGHSEDKLSFSETSALNKCVINPNTIETFGANIHELLSDSFFLEGAHIGELAKKLIYKIVDQLEGVDIPKPLSKDEIYNIINQIGEPWVKSRLLEKFDVFFNTDIPDFL